MKQIKVTGQLAGDPVIPDAFFLCEEREKLVRLRRGWIDLDRSAVVGTLRFQVSVPKKVAQQLLDQWLRRVQIRNRHRLEWCEGPRSRMLARIRYFHILIKGLEPRHLGRATALWEGIAARATLHQIDPEWIGLPSEEPNGGDGNESTFD